MIINCVLIDDEPLALTLLESYVRKTPFLHLTGKFSSAISALPQLGSLSVDLIFLDIQMPELDGLQFSRYVKPETRIIFTTAFSQYAVEGFRVNALDYLMKPISYQDFLTAANKALCWFDLLKEKGPQSKSDVSAPSSNEDLFIKSGYKLVRISMADISYIEGVKDYVKIHLDSEQKPLLALMNIKDLESALPGERFMRIHRSYIVQLSKIRYFEHGCIIFGDKYIPVSDSYKDNLQKYLDEHLLGGSKNSIKSTDLPSGPL